MWLSLVYFGAAAFRAAIDRAMDLARTAQRRIEAEPELELVAGATLAIVCFRRRVDGTDEARSATVNAALLEHVDDSGRVLGGVRWSPVRLAWAVFGFVTLCLAVGWCCRC